MFFGQNEKFNELRRLYKFEGELFFHIVVKYFAFKTLCNAHWYQYLERFKLWYYVVVYSPLKVDQGVFIYRFVLLPA